jgi:hypothetical protein
MSRSPLPHRPLFFHNNDFFCTKLTPERDRDYCIDPLDNPSRINSDTFRIKLFWLEDYRWQDEDFERPWCLDCEKGDCRELGILVVSRCDGDNARFNFMNPSADSVQISVSKENLCLEFISDLDRRRLQLEKCDSGNIYQRFLAGGGKFQRRPIRITTHCSTRLLNTTTSSQRTGVCVLGNM